MIEETPSGRTKPQLGSPMPLCALAAQVRTDRLVPDSAIKSSRSGRDDCLRDDDSPTGDFTLNSSSARSRYAAAKRCDKVTLNARNRRRSHRATEMDWEEALLRAWGGEIPP